VVSAVTVAVSQPLVFPAPVVSQANATVTLVLYQPPEQPPPLHVTVIGAAPAAGAKINSGTLIRINASG
jgi:hypothetical protein